MGGRERPKTKDLYSAEELLSHKLPRKEREEKLVNSLCDIMFRVIGKNFKWAKEHDKEDLHVIDLFVMDEKEYDNFEVLATKILKKQLSCSKEQAKKEVSWFLFSTGLSYYSDKNDYTNLKNIKVSIKNKIKNYEEKHGELTYSDGWEVELKKWIEEE